MPIYEYRCESCGLVFERIVFASSPRVSCPSCGAENVERQPSSFGIGGAARSASGGSSCAGCSRGSCAGCH